MICPTCKKNKSRDDFYWRKDNPNQQSHLNCKKCECERQKERNKKKLAYSTNDFLYAYFH